MVKSGLVCLFYLFGWGNYSLFWPMIQSLPGMIANGSFYLLILKHFLPKWMI